MQEKTYTFDTFNKRTYQGISSALSSFNTKNKPLTLLCIGSDLVVGDSLGPLIGTLLTKKNISAYVYGSLSFPVTAKEVNYAKDYINSLHPNSLVVAIDAAVGESDDVGLIRVIKKGIKPGLGVSKTLKTVGDCSIIGIVAKKEKNNNTLFNLTRLNLIYKMAEQISLGIEDYINSTQSTILN